MTASPPRADGAAADSMRLGLNRHAELPGCDVARNDGEGAVGGQAVVDGRLNHVEGHYPPGLGLLATDRLGQRTRTSKRG